ncbi:CMT1A duplicated region transcript 4 protein [Echinops telfairi]|uniref:CMT1A duplicated region transcript 4 protein n=1 Tax=Echinops telfairi TaxID=9371 RepID=A0ABM0ZTN2_ECHTE|nr:CMT1A duplicated region transcript 4 protein [Echinops telfairi]
MEDALKRKGRNGTRKKKTDEELTENIGLPLNLLEKHDPWPAYVTSTSPVVKKLIEKSRARELECMQIIEERQQQQGSRPRKPSSFTQLKQWKSSSEGVIKDALSETTLSVLGASSAMATGPTALPEPPQSIADSRECPTINCNKIIFSRKPMMRMLPYSSLLASKEKHPDV